MALSTLVQPMLNKILGQQLQPLIPLISSTSLKGGGSATRLSPGSVIDSVFTPAEFGGSAMLRGLSASTGFAVIDNAIDAGDPINFVPFPT